MNGLSWPVLMALSVAAAASAQTASLEELPRTPDGNSWIPRACSADGRVVIGAIEGLQGNGVAKWTPSGGTEVLPLDASPWDCSGDGSVIVGGAFGPGPGARGFIWSHGSVTSVDGNMWSVSSDGTVVAGDYRGTHPAVWSGGTLTQLPYPASYADGFVGRANAISADGSVMVGWVRDRGFEEMPAVWENGGSGSYTVTELPLPGGSERGRAVSVSADGSIRGGFRVRGSGSGDLLRWIDNNRAESLGPTASPWKIAPDGSFMILEGDLWWDPGNGIRPANVAIADLTGLDLSAWQMAPLDISEDGRVVVGVANTPTGRVAWRLCFDPTLCCGLDTDGDGLLDCWEDDGIPYIDQNGELQKYILDSDGDGMSDADKMRKDLFIEVDEMSGFALSSIARQDVIDAFAAAPVANPDFSFGITLHIVMDDGSLPLVSPWNLDASEWFPDHQATRDMWFGDFQERLDAAAGSEVLEAKAKAFRYCIIADRIGGPLGSLHGVAEDIPSDDFVVAAGATVHSDGMHDTDDIAATFMHELGHCLGLGHGGCDDILGKPNYPSIMNYMYADILNFNTNFWTLDYSRAGPGVFPTLNEDDLNENIGISSGGQYDSWIAPFGVDDDMGQRIVKFVRLDGSPTDFGHPLIFDGPQDGDYDTGIVQDLNFLDPAFPVAGSDSPSPGQTLEPHDDWQNLHYPVVDGSNNPAPRRGGEPSDESVAWINANFPPIEPPCEPDLNGDGISDIFDLLTYLDLWFEPDPGADIDGTPGVDIFDLLNYLDLWFTGC